MQIRIVSVRNDPDPAAPSALPHKGSAETTFIVEACKIPAGIAALSLATPRGSS
jgi:hypothetical protein